MSPTSCSQTNSERNRRSDVSASGLVKIRQQLFGQWLYLSGCSCCLSGSLIGCGQPAAGPGRTGLASRGQRGRRWGPFPCFSFPSLRGGSKGPEVSGPSGCPSSCWRCDSLSSCTQERRTRSFRVGNAECDMFRIQQHSGFLVSGVEKDVPDESVSARSISAHR